MCIDGGSLISAYSHLHSLSAARGSWPAITVTVMSVMSLVTPAMMMVFSVVSHFLFAVFDFVIFDQSAPATDLLVVVMPLPVFFFTGPAPWQASALMGALVLSPTRWLLLTRLSIIGAVIFWINRLDGWNSGWRPVFVVWFLGSRRHRPTTSIMMMAMFTLLFAALFVQFLWGRLFVLPFGFLLSTSLFLCFNLLRQEANHW